MITFEDVLQLAEEGNIDAMVVAIQELVWNTEFAIDSEPELRSKVIEYLDTALNAGNVEAMNQLGAMYHEGKVVEQDLYKSFLCYEMAAENGHISGTCNLGFCYFYGDGVEKNYEKAYMAFSKAALVQDVPDAVIRLGDMYLNGYYVKKDEKAAVDLYFRMKRKTEKNLGDFGNLQAYSDVMRRIGDLYFEGRGVEKDVAKAIKCYADALHCYELRERQNDFYASEGLKRTKEKLKRAMEEI